MADLRNTNLSELPFKETIDDNTLTHVHDGDDKKTTFSRLWAWILGKIDPALKGEMLVMADSEGDLKKVGINDFLKQGLLGLLNSLQPLNRDSLVSEGYSLLEISMYEIARKAPFTRLKEYVYLDDTQSTYLQFLDSEPAKEYLLSLGMAFCDGQNGTRDLRGAFLRMVDATAGRDTGRELGTYQQDALQKFSAQTEPVMGPANNVFGGNGIAKTVRTGQTNGWGTTGNYPVGVIQINTDFNSSLRTSNENRPKNISALAFQKVKDIDWRLIPSKPPKFNI